MRQFEQDDMLRAAAGDPDALLRAERRQSMLTLNAQRRRMALLHATPQCADHGPIGVFCAEAKRLSADTGIKHDVDHIIPIVESQRQ